MSAPVALLRPALASDEPFLQAVYAATRDDELAVTGWSEPQQRAFLEMQFRSQHSYYHEQFPNAAFQIVLVNDVPAGRLYVDRQSDEIRVIDIAMLPEFRNTGIGTALLRDVLAEADAAHKPVRIHVERFNRALSLYERLGFARVEDRGVYVLMEWSGTPPVS